PNVSRLSTSTLFPYTTLFRSIATLAERYNAVGRECVARELKAIQGSDDLHAALCRITDGFLRMYRREPAMVALWDATRADPRLQDRKSTRLNSSHVKISYAVF